MRTTKPISTISYNSLVFLRGTLERLKKNGIIQFWVMIRHQAEEDETKDHWHVYLEPGKAIDTLALRKQFNEIDQSDLEHPLGVLPFKPSKFVDWYWYGLHDKQYLASKGQSRKHHYNASEMVTDERDYLDELVRTSPNPKSELFRTLEMISLGMSNAEIALSLNIPLKNLNYSMSAIENVRQDSGFDMITHRNGKKGHENED